jgi:folate-binding protein YgfZ
VTGGDAISFLQGLISQDVGSAPGSVARSFLLSPQGKLRALLWVLIGEQEAILITDSGSSESVISDLTRYRIRVDVQIVPVEVPVFELLGPEAADVLQRAGAAVESGWQNIGNGWVARVPMGGLDRYLFVGIDPDSLMELGAVRCGEQAAAAVRIEAGEPKMPTDVDESTIPQESGLVADSVSFTKGCYLGQELVARIDSRGHVNRHLRGLVVNENVLPPANSEIFSGERAVGVVGTVAESLTRRAPVALALVRREVEPGTEVEIKWGGGSTMARVKTLPLDDFTDL